MKFEGRSKLPDETFTQPRLRGCVEVGSRRELFFSCDGLGGGKRGVLGKEGGNGVLGISHAHSGSRDILSVRGGFGLTAALGCYQPPTFLVRA